MSLISLSAEAARKISAQLTLFNRGGDSDSADSADNSDGSDSAEGPPDGG